MPPRPPACNSRPHYWPPLCAQAFRPAPFKAGARLRRPRWREGGLCYRRPKAIPLLFLRRLLFVAALSLSFELHGSDGLARRGRITTAHGTVETPAFMPVGTAGTVKAMTPQSVAETRTEIVLCDTVHLMLPPGAQRLAALRGPHKLPHRTPP